MWWIVAADQGYCWSYPSDSFRMTHAHMDALQSVFNLSCRERETCTKHFIWVEFYWSSFKWIKGEWVIKYKYTTAGRHADMEVCSHNLSGQNKSCGFTAACLCKGIPARGINTDGWDMEGGVWSYHHMCHVVNYAADVQLSAPVPLCVSDCSVLARGLLVPCGSVKTGHSPICASRCI